LRNTNTLDAFRDIDKQSTISQAGDRLWQDIVSGAALEDPNLLTQFILLTFAVLFISYYFMKSSDDFQFIFCEF